MAAAGLSHPGGYPWLEIELERRSWEARFCVPGTTAAFVCRWLLLARVSEVLQKAVVKHGLLGCEGRTESQSGCEDHRSVEAGWMAGVENLGAPAFHCGFGSPESQSGTHREGVQTG